MLTDLEISAHLRELTVAAMELPLSTTPNPRVGCRIISADGDLVGEGLHGNHGVDHAEVIALTQAGPRAKGGTAIVTLEPCNHTARTGPCSSALVSAGVAEVIFSQSDQSEAAGGAKALQAAGITVRGGYERAITAPLIEVWSHFKSTGTPFVTLKLAATLDGYVAAVDGSSKWITGQAARQHVQLLRAQHDAVLVGTGTAIADNPRLDVRIPGVTKQPLRVVMGQRQLPENSFLRNQALHLSHRDPARALTELAAADVQALLIEGGSEIATSWLKAGLVQRLIWFVSPKLLGTGKSAVGDLGISTISAAIEWQLLEYRVFDQDLMLDLRPH